MRQEPCSFYGNKDIEITWGRSRATEVRPKSEGNCLDLVVTDEKMKEIHIKEMACPSSWKIRADTEKRKTMKYTTQRTVLGERHPDLKKD